MACQGFKSPQLHPRSTALPTVDHPRIPALAQQIRSNRQCVAKALIQADEQILTVHRLLPQVVHDQLNPVTRGVRVGVAVRLLDEAFPSRAYGLPELWPACAQLLPHVLATTDHAVALKAELLATAQLFDSAADYLHGRARYAEAHVLRERALAIAESHLGPDHPTTAAILNNLANVLRDQGELDGARNLLERALAIRGAVLGSDHLDTARSLNNLGGVLREQGDLDGARSLYERALAIRKAHLGADHSDMVRSRQDPTVVPAGRQRIIGKRQTR